jgi:hypothetical protein
MPDSKKYLCFRIPLQANFVTRRNNRLFLASFFPLAAVTIPAAAKATRQAEMLL